MHSSLSEKRKHVQRLTAQCLCKIRGFDIRNTFTKRRRDHCSEIVMNIYAQFKPCGNTLVAKKYLFVLLIPFGALKTASFRSGMLQMHTVKSLNCKRTLAISQNPVIRCLGFERRTKSSEEMRVAQT